MNFVLPKSFTNHSFGSKYNQAPKSSENFVVVKNEYYAARCSVNLLRVYYGVQKIEIGRNYDTLWLLVRILHRGMNFLTMINYVLNTSILLLTVYPS